MRGPSLLLPLLVLTLAPGLLAGCGGPPPLEVVRQFHIAAITQDQVALEEVMVTEGATTPATDFRQLRDIFVFFAKSHPVTDPRYAPKFVDEVCDFAEAPVDAASDADAKTINAVADLSRILVPFLGDAARGVPGKPKEIIRYTVTLRRVPGGWKVAGVYLPMKDLGEIGARYDLDVTAMDDEPISMEAKDPTAPDPDADPAD
ncbi:MAG TPA: hypothetical protein VEI97_03350 [bacterium]|nr:hypothetical protein [bacterium]